MRKVDSNFDGKLDLMEFTALFEDMLARQELVASAKVKFEELDESKTGVLEGQEIDKLMEMVMSVYVERSPEENQRFRKSIMTRIDKNGDSKIDFGEFTRLWDEMLVRQDMVAKAEKKFKELDKDNSGFLEKDELSAVLMEWAGNCKTLLDVEVDTACQELILALDVNGDGKLDLMEFVVLFEQTMAKSGMS
jgi:Ca2+-binding EF-hand superfamily protein